MVICYGVQTDSGLVLEVNAAPSRRRWPDLVQVRYSVQAEVKPDILRLRISVKRSTRLIAFDSSAESGWKSRVILNKNTPANPNEECAWVTAEEGMARHESVKQRFGLACRLTVSQQIVVIWIINADLNNFVC